MSKGKWNYNDRVLDVILMVFIALTMSSLILSPTFLNPISLFAKVCIAEVILVFILHATKRPKRNVALSYIQVGLLFAVAASLISNPSMNSNKDLLSYILIMFIGLQLVSITPPNTIILGVALSGVTTILITNFAIIFSPQTAISAEGQLQGIYGHWNSFGMALILALPAVFTFTLERKKLQRALKALLALVIFIYVILSQSSTSLLAYIALTLAWIIYIAYIRSHKLAVILLSSLGLIGTTIIVYPSLLFQMLGKSETLTGRVQIWEAIVNQANSHWLFGYGWATIIPIDSELFNRIVSYSGIPARHVHNDFLNWFALTGLVGIVFIVGFFAITLFGGTSYLKDHMTLNNLWVPLTVFGLIIEGISETPTITPQGWLLITLTLAVIGTHNESWTRKFYFPPKKHWITA